MLSIAGVSGVIFPFTAYRRVSGFALVCIYVSCAVALVGGLLVAGSGGGSASSYKGGPGYIDENITDELHKDRRRGATLGAELFCIGAVCTALAAWLYNSTS